MAHNNQQAAVQLTLPKIVKAATYARLAKGALKAQNLQKSNLYNIARTCAYEPEQIIVYLGEEVSERDVPAKRQSVQELLHQVDTGTIHSILVITAVRTI